MFQEFLAWYRTGGIGDWELHLFLARYGKVGYLDEVLGAYRKPNGGLYTSASRIQILAQRLAMYEQINAQYQERLRTLFRLYTPTLYQHLAELRQRHRLAKTIHQ